jgi:polysaccharide export outer membrane protein
MFKIHRFLAIGTLVAMNTVALAGTPETLLIGPGDTLHVQILNTPQLEQHPKVTDAGEIPLIGVGNLGVAGLTPAAAAEKIRTTLIEKHYMNHPDVTVTIDEYATQSVSVLGQVKLPGSYDISTPRSILRVVALAGGLTDSADYRITIKRSDPSEKPISYTLSNDPRAAISQEVQVYPGDTVIVPKAGLAYVLGDVGKPGGFVMQNTHSQLTALEAVALAGGSLPSAVPSHAKLIRRIAEGGTTEIALNISAIQKGKQTDLILEPDDVIYIPFSYIRNVASSSSGILASVAGAAVYTVP